MVVGQPPGEIDVMENRGNDPTRVLGTIHFGGSWPNNTYSQGPSYYFPVGDSVTNFHLYAVEWANSSIRWYGMASFIRRRPVGGVPVVLIPRHLTSRSTLS